MNAPIRFVKKYHRIAVVAALLAALTASMTASALGGGTEAAPIIPVRVARLSVSSSGEQGNGASGAPSISADARYVAFASDATNLVAGDVNNAGDIFLRDRQTGTTSLISLSSTGERADSDSYWPVISESGRFVVFTSSAFNLAQGGNDDTEDVFIRDWQKGITELVSVASDGTKGNDHSGPSAAVSADGRYVAFDSDASNLVVGDANAAGDVFLRDRQAGTTIRVSLAAGGGEANGGSWGPSISNDGRYVAFSSGASNLVSNDANGKTDVFVYDTAQKTIVRASVNSDGEEAQSFPSRSASISGDGRYVAFMSQAANLTSLDTHYYDQIYVHDLQTGETAPISISLDEEGMMVADSDDPVISGDGRYVVFTSDSKYDGMPGLEIYLRDRQANAAVQVTNGRSSYEGSFFHPDVSDGGNFVVFMSESSKLVPGDTNGTSDVFIRDMTPVVPITAVYKSAPQADGWILESGENSNAGRRVDKLSTVVNVGDGVRDLQYRGLLSFNTGSLPDNAVILSAVLRLTRQGAVGTDPFATHGDLLAEIRAGTFGASLSLQANDFSASASAGSALESLLQVAASRYAVSLRGANLPFVNKYGVTQFRLRFELDDNDDMGADYLKLYSGNAAEAYRPVLTVTYYLP